MMNDTATQRHVFEQDHIRMPAEFLVLLGALVFLFAFVPK
jgi:hypothetical protein